MVQTHIIEGTGEELGKWLSQQPNERFRVFKLSDDTSFDTYEEALAGATNRTPEAIAAARARVLEASPSPHEIPDGMTLEDIVLGQWPGDETDEEILSALEKLS